MHCTLGFREAADYWKQWSQSEPEKQKILTQLDSWTYIWAQKLGRESPISQTKMGNLTQVRIQIQWDNISTPYTF